MSTAAPSHFVHRLGYGEVGFKSYGWKGNGIRYSFMLLSLAVVITAAALGELILAPAVIVLLYVLASLLTQRNSAA